MSSVAHALTATSTLTDGDAAWCCVVTGDYDRQLAAFLRSLRQHFPHAACTVFKVGPTPSLAPLADLAEIVDLTPDLRLSFVPGTPGAPTWVSVVMACKPLALLRMLAAGHRRVVYADADLWMLAPPLSLLHALRDAAVVLTPHVVHRAASARALHNDLVVLNAGTFNSGLVAVSASDEGRAFCMWWAERTLTLKDQPDGFASDQRWLNLVPHLFRDVVALSDPGLNVGHWRLEADTDVERSTDGYVLRGQPLSLLHMSGYDARTPSRLSKYAPDLALREGTALRELADRYASCLAQPQESPCTDPHAACRLTNAYAHPMLRQAATTLTCATRGRGLVDITSGVAAFVRDSNMRTGLVTLFIRHTSASLLIQENADPAVCADLDRFFARLVPDGDPIFRHRDEGADDMPAHVRAALTSVQLSIPIVSGAMSLGTWQGIYVWEHRTRPHRREVVVHVQGE